MSLKDKVMLTFLLTPWIVTWQLMSHIPAKDSKYFTCKCVRCIDPTELGSHFSTLYCQKCPQGLLLSTQPINTFANWKCGHCGNTLKSKDIEELIETLEKEVSELPLDKDVYEEKLKVYEKLLHPNHHIMIDLKFTLVQVKSIDKLINVFKTLKIG